MECWLRDKCKKYQEVKECDASCIKFIKLDYLFKNSLLSDIQRKHLNLIAENIDSEAFKKLKGIENTIEQFVNNGDNLYIYSNITGNGKTAWATRFIQAYFNKIWPKCSLSCKALFINVPKFFLELKHSLSNPSAYIDHIKANICSADIVVWDEVATKAATEFEHENLLSLIDYRINLGKSNIYTSNIFPEELEIKLGMRLYSRIINNSTIIQLRGQDKRGLI